MSATFDGVFDTLGLRSWCDQKSSDSPTNMQDLLNRLKGNQESSSPWWEIPFPSLDNLNQACPAIPKTRDMTTAIEQGFLDLRDPLKFILDPLTQPLSWMLDGSLTLFENIPWWLLMPLMLLLVFRLSKSTSVTALIAISLVLLAFIDHYIYAIQTLSIIFVCTVFCVVIGVPLGIFMSKKDSIERAMIPVLDMLQTLPAFVYLIPLIFLFSVTESKLYGIAIILYAIVPVIRLTNLGIRLVDKEVLEAATAYGMSFWQKLWKVEIPLAIPTIMAGINQTIMMSLAMVVIASLVSAPGLGVLVLRGIRNLELGVGLVSGIGIVILAVMLDRVTKKTLQRIDNSS